MEKLSKKDGLASIMVVMMTVIIMTVGLSIVALSKTDEDLSVRKNQWIYRFYNLEGQVMEDIATLNLVFNNENIKNKINIKTLKSALSNMKYELNSDIELSYTRTGVIIKLFLSEKEKNNPMFIDAIIEKKSGEDFVIRELIQRQGEYEYKSFY